jgi:hypothetical protein
VPLYTSTRVVNDTQASVTVVVREQTGGGGYDANVTVSMSVVPTEVTFGNGHTAGHVPTAPTRVIAWQNVTVGVGATEMFTAFYTKNPNSDALQTTVTCTVIGTYPAGSTTPYAETRQAVIVWP